jgi:hypothetical protein
MMRQILEAIRGLGRFRFYMVFAGVVVWFLDERKIESFLFGLIPALVVLYTTLLAPFIGIFDAMDAISNFRRNELTYIQFVMRLSWAFLVICNGVFLHYFVGLIRFFLQRNG